MWLTKFHSLFPLATERRTGRRQNLSSVEDHVRRIKDDWKVDRRVLEVIEDPESGWDYPKWWPRLSATLEEPVPLPTHIYSQAGTRIAVKSLQDAIKNIEIVSVILRFICPEGFAIFSPPVVSFLCPSPSANAAESYLSYLKVLKDLKEHYKVLERVADIDMALWSAAHLVHEPDCAALSEEMYQDDFLQKVRLRNLVKGLEGFWRRTGRERLILAGVLIDRDFVSSAVITARVYESVLREMMEYSGTTKGVFQKMNLALVRELEHRQQIVGLGLHAGQLEALWNLRHKAVHGELDFTVSKAALFQQGVEEVWQAWRKRTAKIR